MFKLGARVPDRPPPRNSTAALHRVIQRQIRFNLDVLTVIQRLRFGFDASVEEVNLVLNNLQELIRDFDKMLELSIEEETDERR